jgi:hypothetical protein
MISNSPRTISKSPSMVAWNVVNKQNGTPMASPILAKGEETFAQLAKNVLLGCPEGRTSEQISIAIHETGMKGNDLNVIKPNVSAALSSHSRSDKSIFKKGPQSEEKKQIWLLRNPSDSPLMTNESLERTIATDAPDTTIGVDTLQEHGSGKQHSTTSGRVYAHESRPAEEGAEPNEDEATALPDTNSGAIARMINNVIASAGQTPPPGASDGPAAALAVELSRDYHLHESQQACPPPTNQLEEPPALDPQPSVHESGRAVNTCSPPPALMMENGSVSASQRITVGREPTQSIAREIQTGPAIQQMSPEEALPLHLAAMVSMHVRKFNDSHQQQPLVFQKNISSDDRSDGDPQAALEEVIRQLCTDATLDSTLSQPVSTFQDAQKALVDIQRARAIEGHIDVAIKDYNIVQAEMNAKIDSLKQVVADLASSRRSLQEAKGQAEASIKASRERVGAFIGDQANYGRNH